MRRSKELAEIISDLKNEIPGFNKDKLLEYAKWTITNLYNSLKNNQEVNLDCNPDLINKLIVEKDKYKIVDNIDRINIQYIELFDYIRNNNEIHIQLYLSVFFYDNVTNNNDENEGKDKYWNDIWLVTLKENMQSEEKSDTNCTNCGAVMQYDPKNDMFKCEYCGNVVCNTKANWQIIDIELGD